MILPTVRDPRMVTIRRGGTLRDEHHRLLARWAALCAEHVLDLFETPADGTMSMVQSRARGGHAMGAARPLRGAARYAAYSAGQAACVGHVAEHDLGAAAYALKAVRSAQGDDALRDERDWQRAQLPAEVRELVLEDQSSRDVICWNVFSL